jgi:hypothetical protein
MTIIVCYQKDMVKMKFVYFQELEVADMVRTEAKLAMKPETDV